MQTLEGVLESNDIMDKVRLARLSCESGYNYQTNNISNGFLVQLN